MKKIYKSSTDRILTGMLGGLAEHLEVDSTIIRLGFMVVFLVTGFFPLGFVYLIAFFIIQERPANNTVSEQ